MTIKKRKKHDYVSLVHYMRMLDDGYSFRYIQDKHGICAKLLKVLRAKYLKEGCSALKKQKYVKADYELKKQIVLDIEKNHITLHGASLKYGVSISSIKVCLKKYRQQGLPALEQTEKCCAPQGRMGRPKKNSRPLTELERLQKENQELKTEIALLKKVRALVEERNARLKEIGRGSSKN